MIMNLTENRTWTSILMAAAMWVPGATASVVTFESLPGNNTRFGTATDYLTNWEALRVLHPDAPSGYGISTVGTWDYPSQGNVDNHQLVAGGSSVNLAYHYRVEFGVSASQAGVFDFRIAPDFGMGGAVFVDGTPVAHKSDDLWWGLYWGASSELLEFRLTLAAGDHVMDIYGQEQCCDGPTGGQFSRDGGRTWVALGEHDGMNRVADRGSMLGMMALALVGLGLWRRGSGVGVSP